MPFNLHFKYIPLISFTIFFFLVAFWIQRKNEITMREYYNGKIIKSFGTILKDDKKVKKFANKFTFRSPDLSRQLPKSFNGPKLWEEYLAPIKNQGKCGNCWAQASVFVLSTRISLITDKMLHLDLSGSKLTACGAIADINRFESYDIIKKYKGNIDKLWNDRKKDPKISQLLADIVRKTASCSGQSLYDAATELYIFGTTTNECVPFDGVTLLTKKKYNIKEATDWKKIPSCFDLAGTDIDTCTNGEFAMRNYRVSDIYNIEPNEISIKAEIYKWGPVMSGFKVFPDFMDDYDGTTIYTHPKKEQTAIGGHAISILGWGEEMQDGVMTKYWWCSNSWSVYWGMNGFFKMKMFIEECQLEQNVIGAIPDLPGFNPNDVSNDIISKWDQDMRSGKNLPSHYIDEETGYVNTGITKIKDGELKGELTPLFDKKLLPNFNTYWAADRTGLKSWVRLEFKDRGMLYVYWLCAFVIYIILVIFFHYMELI